LRFSQKAIAFFRRQGNSKYLDGYTRFEVVMLTKVDYRKSALANLPE
jgi:hypothetical protein